MSAVLLDLLRARERALLDAERALLDEDPPPNPREYESWADFYAAQDDHEAKREAIARELRAVRAEYRALSR